MKQGDPFPCAGGYVGINFGEIEMFVVEGYDRGIVSKIARIDDGAGPIRVFEDHLRGQRVRLESESLIGLNQFVNLGELRLLGPNSEILGMEVRIAFDRDQDFLSAP